MRIVIGSLAMLMLTVRSAFADSTIHFDMQGQSTEYRVGVDPRVKITVTNVSPSVLEIPHLQACTIAEVTVRDAAGSLIQPAPINCPVEGSRALMLREYLSQGQHYTLINDWNKPGGEWVPLSHWGFTNLPPGRYTITARPGAAISAVADSNALMLTIER